MAATTQVRLLAWTVFPFKSPLHGGELPCWQDTFPEWSKGVDSSSTSASCVGSNPTGVIVPLPNVAAVSLAILAPSAAAKQEAPWPNGRGIGLRSRELQARVLPGSFAKPLFADILKQIDHATALGLEPGSLRSCLGHVEPRPLLARGDSACVSLLLLRSSPQHARMPRLPKLQLSLSHPLLRCLICRDGRKPEASKAYEARPQLAPTATEGMPPHSTKLRNQIYVHRASQRALNFAAQLVQQNRLSG